MTTTAQTDDATIGYSIISALRFSRAKKGHFYMQKVIVSVKKGSYLGLKSVKTAHIIKSQNYYHIGSFNNKSPRKREVGRQDMTELVYRCLFSDYMYMACILYILLSSSKQP